MKLEELEIKNCRVCGCSSLEPILSLGNQYVVNFVSTKEEQEEVPQVPLDLVLCSECKLLQLKHNAPAESMWSDQYWYKSAINKMIRANLQEIVTEANEIIKTNESDIVVDIGCNDGTLLNFYTDKLTKVGFEPSSNVAKEAQGPGKTIFNDFFNASNFQENFGEKKAKIITAISMFYDLEDPNKFLEDITKILDKEGLFVIQQNYLVEMLKNNAFDNICHEHREYYSIYSLNNLLKRHNLEIFDVFLNGINGGSIRTLIRFKGSKLTSKPGAQERIKDLEAQEKHLRLHTSEPYQQFAKRIAGIKSQLLEFITQEKSKGKKICGLGASTRGLVLLQYLGLGPEMMDYIYDKNPDKEGKKTVGNLIPITSPVNVSKHNPDYQMVLIWHLFKSLGEDEKEFLNKGGQFILPLPEMKIISGSEI